MEVFISNFYIYPKRNILFECIPINFAFAVHSQFKNLCPKNRFFLFFFFFFFLSKRFITKNSTLMKHRSCKMKLRLKQMYMLSAKDTVCQSSYIALSYKVSLLSRQRTTKARGCASWSAPLLFTYDKTGFLMMWPSFRSIGRTSSV